MIYLTRERKQEIREVAKGVRLVFGTISKPIDLDELLRRLNFKIFEGNLDEFYPNQNVSGILSIKDGVRKIFINNAHADTRNRFTVVHELGHFFLHDEQLKETGTMLSFRGNYEDRNDLMEAEADYFAAELLMPREIMYVLANDSKKNSVKYLSEYFGVSQPAMARRINDLNAE